ncbi:MAG: low photochemical bleaching 1 [Trebouxia sp. A1-2]|nr:MAG: low photochemical bleaching 1 [Trebouxia sp. A1-2]
MQLSVVDHPRVLARGSPKPVNSFSATAAASIHVYKQQFRDSRAVPWAFGRKSLPANNARTLFRSETSELRCAAGKSEQSQQDVRAELQCQVDRLTNLLGDLQAATTWHDKVLALQNEPGIQKFFSTYRHKQLLLEELVSLSSEEVYTILCLPAMSQEHVLNAPMAEGTCFRSAVQQLASTLKRVEIFYNSIGGLLGYHRKCLQIMLEGSEQQTSQVEPSTVAAEEVTFHMPQGPNLAGPNGRQLAAESAAAGLEALPHMAEIYPLGGAGDRLGLKCEHSGEGLPVAVLPYCGRPLLESLIRDVQAREYLYFKLHGVQQMTPIAIMTSDAKDNHRRVTEFINNCDWFGRGKESFRLFRQPLVPLVSAADGKWLVPQGLAPILKPGGHGAIWKLMLDEGVFSWMYQHDREAAIVRQISNPMAGTDTTLLSLSGAGYTDSRSFGFASCPRVVGAAEGMNVLLERKLQRPDGRVEHAYNVTNVEYTEFEKQGICDVPAAPGSQYSCFPANTNVLYVGLKAAELAVRAGVEAGGGAALPGMILNTSKKTAYTDATTGQEHSVPAGRMECTMQNLVDSLAQHFQEAVPSERHGELNTFVVYNQRSRVTSSAKRKRQPGSLKIHQTPDGSFFDLMRNARDLLLRCGFEVPQLPEVKDYLDHGPSFIFLFHPSLGPLWDVVAQKVQGGSLANKAELVLEVAEACITQLHVDGSLRVQAHSVMGGSEDALAVNYNQIRSRHDLQLHQQTSRTLWQSGAANGSSDSTGRSAGASQTALPLHQELSNILGGGLLGGGTTHMPAYRQSSKVAGQRLVYSNRCGRVMFKNVIVQNQGVDWEHEGNIYWQHKVQRHESCTIILHGRSEFEASNVTIPGTRSFDVPDGYKMVVTAGPNGAVRSSLEPLQSEPSWHWKHSMGPNSNIHLQLEKAASSRHRDQLKFDAAPLSYII